MSWLRTSLSPGRVFAGICGVVLWCLLQGQFTLVNVLAGCVVVAVLLTLIGPRGRHRYQPHPLGMMRFCAVVTWSLVTSSVQVMIATFVPTAERTSGRFVEVTLPGASPVSMTLVANAISVTPGTITLDAALSSDGVATMTIHVFGDIVDDEFRRDIADLHRLALGCVTATQAAATATDDVGEVSA